MEMTNEERVKVELERKMGNDVRALVGDIIDMVGVHPHVRAPKYDEGTVDMPKEHKGFKYYEDRIEELEAENKQLKSDLDEEVEYSHTLKTELAHETDYGDAVTKEYTALTADYLDLKAEYSNLDKDYTKLSADNIALANVIRLRDTR